MADTIELQTGTDGGGNIGLLDGRNSGGEEDDIERLIREAEAHANGNLIGGLALRSVNRGLMVESPFVGPPSYVHMGRITLEREMPIIHRN